MRSDIMVVAEYTPVAVRVPYSLKSVPGIRLEVGGDNGGAKLEVIFRGPAMEEVVEKIVRHVLATDRARLVGLLQKIDEEERAAAATPPQGGNHAEG